MVRCRVSGPPSARPPGGAARSTGPPPSTTRPSPAAPASARPSSTVDCPWSTARSAVTRLPAGPLRRPGPVPLDRVPGGRVVRRRPLRRGGQLRPGPLPRPGHLRGRHPGPTPPVRPGPRHHVGDPHLARRRPRRTPGHRLASPHRPVVPPPANPNAGTTCAVGPTPAQPALSAQRRHELRHIAVSRAPERPTCRVPRAPTGTDTPRPLRSTGTARKRLAACRGHHVPRRRRHAASRDRRGSRPSQVCRAVTVVPTARRVRAGRRVE